VLANRAVVYDLLLHSAAATLRAVAANPLRLSAMVGVLMVLHTWGQNLHHHPHVHCVGHRRRLVVRSCRQARCLAALAGVLTRHIGTAYCLHLFYRFRVVPIRSGRRANLATGDRQ
jgi:hypothetical protein